MDLLLRLLSGLGLFLASLLAGWWGGRRGWLPERRASALIRLIVTRLSPVVLCLSFWGLKELKPALAELPVIGVLVSLSTLIPASAYARYAKLSRPETGSFLTCALFSNLGFFGALIAFSLHGEAAFSLTAIHMLFFSPLFYTVGISLATRYGHAQSVASGRGLADELRVYPVAGLLLGIVLNLLRVPRPSLLGAVNHVLIPVDTMGYIIAVSSQVRWNPSGAWRQSVAAMSAIKFLYCPLVAWLLVDWAGLTGLPRFVVLLQSAMPVAVSPLMLPLLFGLEKRLSHALWVVTTAVAIGWMLLYIPLIR